jgi:hypothetical protein
VCDVLDLIGYLADPSRMPHANPSDIPPSTVAGHGAQMWVLVVVLVGVGLALAAIALLRRPR